MSNTVAKGNEVEISYTGRLKDQTIFDSTEGREPFKFVTGSENIIKGMNDAVIGMNVGEKKTIEIAPEDAYGPYRDELVAKVPKANIPEGVNVGDVLTDSNENNWWVRQINDDSAILDGNHPLAGQALIFDIELLKILN